MREKLEAELKKILASIKETQKEIESAERYDDHEELSELLGELKELENEKKILTALIDELPDKTTVQEA